MLKVTPGSKFSFTSVDEGEHRICIIPKFKNSKVLIKHKIQFDFYIGYIDQISKPLSLDSMGLLIEKLHKSFLRLQEVHYEQELLRSKEQSFQFILNNTNFKIVKWSLIQTTILILVGYFQLNHLKSFFVKQKIV